jgi:hypothetical protein
LFQGRTDILGKIKSYIINDDKNQPFVISGAAGLFRIYIFILNKNIFIRKRKNINIS